MTSSRLGGPCSSVDDIRTYWWEVVEIVNFEKSLAELQSNVKGDVIVKPFVTEKIFHVNCYRQ